MNKLISTARYNLAQVLADAIVEGEVPLHYLVGDEPNPRNPGTTRPDRHWLKQLRDNLQAAGFTEAAAICTKELERP